MILFFLGAPATASVYRPAVDLTESYCMRTLHMQTLIDDHVASRGSPGVCGVMNSLLQAGIELFNSLTDGSLFLPRSLIKDQYLLSLRSWLLTALTFWCCNYMYVLLFLENDLTFICYNCHYNLVMCSVLFFQAQATLMLVLLFVFH